MIPYIEHCKDSARRLLELISEFSKISGYRIDVQKPVAYWHTNNEATEDEIKNMVPFIIAPKPIKYLGINLSKKVRDLHTENYKTLVKGIEEDTKNGLILCAHGLEELISLTYPYYPKQSSDLMQSLSKYQ